MAKNHEQQPPGDVSQDESPPRKTSRNVPIVAIGASADGLDTPKRGDISEMDPTDISELIHELDVQNAELRRAHDELTEERDRYRDLYENAPVGYITVDTDGVVQRANLAAAKLCGRPRGEILDRRLEKLVAPADRDTCYLLLRQAGDDTASGEVTLDRPDETEMRVRVEILVDGPEDGPRYHVTLTDITDRSRAEAALAHERELLQRIVDTIPVLLVMWDPRMERFTLNRHASEVLGWTTEDANEGDFMKKAYPDPSYRREVEEYMASLNDGWRELLTTARNGEQIPIDWANVRLTDDTMVGIGVDPRERKAAEQAARTSERQYRLAAWAAGLGAYSRNLKTGEDYWSPEFKEIYGLGEDDEVELKAGLPAAVHPDDYEDVLEETRRREQGEVGPRFSSEHRIIRPDGQMRWVLVRGRMEFDDDGQPEAVYGFAMDITEQKWAQRALRESEQRFRSLVESSAQAVWETTPEGMVIKDSPSWREFTGQHLEQWLAEGWIDAVHPDDRDVTRLVWEKAVRSGEPLETEYRLQRPNGTYSWTIVRAAPIHDAEGNIVKWVGMNVDITDRKETELALREAREKLEHRVNERTAELRQTVRDLETAVARQELAEQVLRERSQALFDLNEELEKRAGQLQALTLQLSLAEDRERHRLSEILHDDLQQMLVAARFQLDSLVGSASGSSAAKGFEQVSTLIAQAIEQTRDLSHQLYPAVLHQRGLLEAMEWLADDLRERHGLEVELSLAEEGEPKTDQLKPFLFKTVRELLFNVVKHSGVREATVSIERDYDVIEVRVADEGNGFDAGQLGTGSEKAGLGLLTIRERGEFLGGSVEIQSTPGDGSRFIIRVPDLADG
jgi:PAS domain S-box-containing protein